MKKSDYKIDVSFIFNGIVFYDIFRRARKEYKIGKWTFYFTGKFEPISKLLTRKDAEAALLEIYEWIDGGGK